MSARSRRLPSLDLVREEVIGEREMQLRHFDGLDAKAGVLLGFAGLFAVLAAGDLLVIEIGRWTAVISAAASLYSFWPRDYPVTDVRTLRDDYTHIDEEFTKLRLMDSQIEMIEQTRAQLLRKASRLKIATGSLAASVLLAAIGFAVRFFS